MCSVIPSFVHFTQALGQDLEGGVSKAISKDLCSHTI